MTTATFNAGTTEKIVHSIIERLEQKKRERLRRYLKERADEINAGFFHKLFRRPVVTPDDVLKNEPEWDYHGFHTKLGYAMTAFDVEIGHAREILRCIAAGALTVDLDSSFLKWYEG